MVGRQFVQMVSKDSVHDWRVPFVQPLNYREGLRRVMAVQIIILDKVADASNDEDLLFSYEEDEKFHNGN